MTLATETIREMSIEQIDQEIEHQLEKLHKYKMASAVGDEPNTAQHKVLKKNIARLRTVKTQKLSLLSENSKPNKKLTKAERNAKNAAKPKNKRANNR